jgi:hypothetical protein
MKEGKEVERGRPNGGCWKLYDEGYKDPLVELGFLNL